MGHWYDGERVRWQRKLIEKTEEMQIGNKLKKWEEPAKIQVVKKVIIYHLL